MWCDVHWCCLLLFWFWWVFFPHFFLMLISDIGESGRVWRKMNEYNENKPIEIIVCFDGTMIIPFRQHFETYDHLIWFCQRYSTCKHGPFWKATCGITLGGCKCDCVLITCICLVLGYLAFDFMYIQTLGLTMV